MIARFQIAVAAGWLALAVLAQAQPRVSDDRELKPLDLTKWDCLNEPGGNAKTDDGVERNKMKNREPVSLAGQQIPSFDTAQFLEHVRAFDNLTKHKRRNELTAPERQQLEALEKQAVSLTAYLVIAYAGPPETTNCKSVDYHDWHLELFERPQDHAPGIGDPTPIICEITPRTQTPIFNAGIRIQKLAGFIRTPDIRAEPTGHPPQRVRITGFLLWDDEHNGKADIGTKVERVAANKFHQPWRSTAWEIHPVLKIEPVDQSLLSPPSTAPLPSVAPPETTPAAAPSATVVATATPRQEVTILEQVKIKIPYGETVLPRGMRLPVVGRDAQTVRVNYLGQTVVVPVQSTDLR